MEKDCSDCEFFHSCGDSDVEDLGGYCSCDPSVIGMCSLWDGPKYDLTPCKGFSEDEKKATSCVSCAHFHSCRVDGADAKGFCGIDKEVVGICTLWNGPKRDVVGCNNWTSK